MKVQITRCGDILLENGHVIDTPNLGYEYGLPLGEDMEVSAEPMEGAEYFELTDDGMWNDKALPWAMYGNLSFCREGLIEFFGYVPERIYYKTFV